jgi:hypothetical protein
MFIEDVVGTPSDQTESLTSQETRGGRNLAAQAALTAILIDGSKTVLARNWYACDNP